MLKRSISLFIVLSIILTIVVGCTANEEGFIIDDESDNIQVEDMAGRTITLSDKVDKVFATIPTGTILLYSLNPEKMVGWNYDLSEGEKEFIPDQYHDLPNLGGASKNAINIEELLKIDPDVLVMMEEIEDNSISKAEELEEQTGKPVIILDSDLDRIDEAYEILGKVMNEKERAEKLKRYCRETLDNAKENTYKISEEDKVTVYYAQGVNGLETEPSGSWHVEVLDMVGGKNVAEVSIDGDYGKSQVSIEQLLTWDPEIIISWEDDRGGYYSEISEDLTWKDIKAVKDGEIYEIPNKPFNWFDRPPSVNRILGLKWLGNLLYPEVYDYNMRDEVKEFYDKFYHYQLSEEEIDELLENSIRY